MTLFSGRKQLLTSFGG